LVDFDALQQAGPAATSGADSTPQTGRER
jgi:hypothetical protein